FFLRFVSVPAEWSPFCFIGVIAVLACLFVLLSPFLLFQTKKEKREKKQSFYLFMMLSTGTAITPASALLLCLLLLLPFFFRCFLFGCFPVLVCVCVCGCVFV